MCNYHAILKMDIRYKIVNSDPISQDNDECEQLDQIIIFLDYKDNWCSKEEILNGFSRETWEDSEGIRYILPQSTKTLFRDICLNLDLYLSTLLTMGKIVKV